MRYKTKLDIEAYGMIIPPGSSAEVLSSGPNLQNVKCYIVNIYPIQGGILQTMFGENAFFRFFEPDQEVNAVIA